MAFSMRVVRRFAPAAVPVLSGSLLWCSPARREDAPCELPPSRSRPLAAVAGAAPLGDSIQPRGGLQALPRITPADLMRTIGRSDGAGVSDFAKRTLEDMVAAERERGRLWPTAPARRAGTLSAAATAAWCAARDHLREAHARAAVDEDGLLQGCEVWKDQVYVPIPVEGWRVLMNTRLLTEDAGRLGDEVLRLMRAQLIHVTRVVPPKQLAQLQDIPIWVEVDNTGHIECCCYNISSEWLSQHGYNPAKVKGIEITHARRFLSYSIDQPHMLLHELAHGFHGRVLGFDNQYVRQCYEAAVASGKYEQVLRNSAHTCKHYGITDEKEYFAKLTETWLGTSDFYPFVHAELRTHDAGGWHLVNDTWGPPPTHWDYKPPWERRSDAATSDATLAPAVSGGDDDAIGSSTAG